MYRLCFEAPGEFCGDKGSWASHGNLRSSSLHRNAVVHFDLGFSGQSPIRPNAMSGKGIASSCLQREAHPVLWNCRTWHRELTPLVIR